MKKKSTGWHILASLHFNENVLRQTQQSDDGDAYYKVTYPKFKLGEEVVREVAVPPTYGKLHNTVRSLFFYSCIGEQYFSLT